MSWRFNPPPGWPVPPDQTWVPPPGWAPDPSWPPAPPGWDFWVPSGAPPAPGSQPGQGGLPPVDPWPAQAPFQVQPPEQQQPPAGQPPMMQPPAYQPPPGGYPPGGYPPPGPPAGGSRGGRPWLIAGVVGAVLLVLCTGGTVAVAVNWDRLAGDDPPSPVPTGSVPGGSAGWEDCDQNPNTCNSGAVGPGGELAWAATGADSWNVNTSLGYTTTVRQIMTGVAPSAGVFLPDGSWQWNLDLLAAEPEVVSEDPHTWIYRIRPEAVWSDGTPITADDFAFQWRQSANDPALCDGCVPVFIDGYDRIEQVEGSDGGKTVTVTLKDGQGYPDWWSLFSYLYPAHVAEAAGFDLGSPTGMAEASQWFEDTVPDWSGGPWLVAEGDLRQRVVLEPNDAWYGQVSPSLDRITFQIIEDPETQAVALSNGEVDGLGPRSDPQPVVEPITGVFSHIGAGYIWDHLDFNLERPGMDDVELRRAIFTAIDLQAIIELAYGMRATEMVPKLNHIVATNSPYYEDHLTATGQGTGDPTAALNILEQAGYELADNVLTRDGDQVGPLVLQYSEGHQRRTIVAELVADQLAGIGIEVDLQTGPLFEVLEQGEYDLVSYGWSGNPAYATSGYQYWHSDSPSNYGSYQNSEVDRLVTEASFGTDSATAADLLNQANAIVASEAYVLPITHTPEQNLLSDRFRNIRPNPADTIFYNSHEWGLAGG